MDLNADQNFYLFKEGIKPLWEDPSNLDGGKWVVLDKGRAGHLGIAEWLTTATAVLRGELGYTDDILGVCFSIRSWGCMWAVWNRNATNKTEIEEVAKKIQALFTIEVLYQPHRLFLQKMKSKKHKLQDKRRRRRSNSSTTNPNPATLSSSPNMLRKESPDSSDPESSPSDYYLTETDDENSIWRLQDPSSQDEHNNNSQDEHGTKSSKRLRSNNTNYAIHNGINYRHYYYPQSSRKNIPNNLNTTNMNGNSSNKCNEQSPSVSPVGSPVYKPPMLLTRHFPAPTSPKYEQSKQTVVALVQSNAHSQDHQPQQPTHAAKPNNIQQQQSTQELNKETLSQPPKQNETQQAHQKSPVEDSISTSPNNQQTAERTKTASDDEGEGEDNNKQLNEVDDDKASKQISPEANSETTQNTYVLKENEPLDDQNEKDLPSNNKDLPNSDQISAPSSEINQQELIVHKSHNSYPFPLSTEQKALGLSMLVWVVTAAFAWYSYS